MTTATKSTRSKHKPAQNNEAVARCFAAWQRTMRQEIARDQAEFYAKEAANEVYCETLPPLAGHQNISDFIACVTYAMANGFIAEKKACKLLYAAQVAICVLGREPKSQPPAAA